MCVGPPKNGRYLCLRTGVSGRGPQLKPGQDREDVRCRPELLRRPVRTAPVGLLLRWGACDRTRQGAVITERPAIGGSDGGETRSDLES